MSPELISLFTAAFVTFFVLIDAPGVAPIFATLTAKGSPAYRRKMAYKSVFVATIIMLLFAGLLEGFGRQLITDTVMRYAIGTAMLLPIACYAVIAAFGFYARKPA